MIYGRNFPHLIIRAQYFLGRGNHLPSLPPSSYAPVLTIDFEQTYIKKGCYASGAHKGVLSCEISNQMFFSVIFSFSRIKDGLVMT